MHAAILDSLLAAADTDSLLAARADSLTGARKKAFLAARKDSLTAVADSLVAAVYAAKDAADAAKDAANAAADSLKAAEPTAAPQPLALKLSVTPKQPLDDQWWYDAAQQASRLLMMVRSVNFTYSNQRSLSLPGFMPNVGDMFGQRTGDFLAPGLDFAF